MSGLRLRRMIRKEFIQLRRDPSLVRMVFVAPILQLLVFGYAVSFDVNKLATAVCDVDQSAASRALIQRMEGSGYFSLRERTQSPKAIRGLVESRRAQVVLWVPRGFERDLLAGRRPQLQAIFDATDSNTAAVGAGYLSGVVEQFARGYADRRLQVVMRGLGGGVMTPETALRGVELRPRVWFNPELRSVNFMVPGVLATILMIVTSVMT